MGTPIKQYVDEIDKCCTAAKKLAATNASSSPSEAPQTEGQRESTYLVNTSVMHTPHAEGKEDASGENT